MAENTVTGKRLLVMAGSAGSLEVLLRVLPQLNPALLVPLVVVLHRRNPNDSILTRLLAARTTLTVLEVEEKEMPVAGVVYIVPADYHLLFEKDGSFALDDSERVNYSRPSIDVVFESAADVFGPGLTCVLLSGANADGAAGSRYARSKGATVIVQAPDSAAVSYMPEQAISLNAADHIWNEAQMVAYINSLV